MTDGDRVIGTKIHHIAALWTKYRGIVIENANNGKFWEMHRVILQYR